MDAGFQRMDHKIEEEFRRLELLIKSKCGGVIIQFVIIIGQSFFFFLVLVVNYVY